MLRLAQRIRPYGVRNYAQQTKRYVDLSGYTLSDIIIAIENGEVDERPIFDNIKTRREVDAEYSFPTSFLIKNKLIVQRLAMVSAKYKIFYVYPTIGIWVAIIVFIIKFCIIFKYMSSDNTVRKGEYVDHLVVTAIMTPIYCI